MSEKKLKILQVHNFYQIPGGEDTVVANEKKMLEDHGHVVVQYTRDNNELKHFSLLKKLALPVITIFNPKTYRDVKQIIREQNIDVVHVHNTLNLISPSVYYAALACKVPVMQTVHNFRLLCPGATFYRDGRICEDCLELGLGCAVRHRCYRNSRLQTLACVLNITIHRALGIYGKLNYICLTEFNKEKLLNLKQIDPNRVFVKPNFVESVGKIHPYDQRKDQFIFVGRIDKLKGIDILLEAWKLMGQSAPRLLICGTGPMEDWCREYIKCNELTMVEMRGFVPNEEARRLIGESKALILPTQLYEGFPMTIVEAYSVGTPIITGDLGNAGDLVEEQQTGTHFVHDSPESLATVIENLNQQDISAWHENSFKIYQERYTRQKNYEILMRGYNGDLT